MKIKEYFLHKFMQPNGIVGRIFLLWMGYLNRGIINFGLNLVHWQANWNVLDIGCGNGLLVRKLLRCCSEGKVYGVDVSLESIKFAEYINKDNLHKRCFLALGCADKLPYESEAFDTITTFETIYFFEDLAATFQEMNRVLKDKGILLIGCKVANTNKHMLLKDTPVVADKVVESLYQADFSKVSTYQSRHGICFVAVK